VTALQRPNPEFKFQSHQKKKREKERKKLSTSSQGTEVLFKGPDIHLSLRHDSISSMKITLSLIRKEYG
jgi:hypothetical protein